MRINKIISTTAFLSLVLSTTNSALAIDEFYNDKARGWFWYEDPPEEIVPEEEELLPPPPPLPAPPKPTESSEKTEGPPMFSVLWLKEQLPALRQRALDQPTDRNLRTYLYAQRVMMDKADQFTRTWQRVVATDPFLDENNRFPIATAFQSVALRGREKAKRDVLKWVGKRAGIFYFFKSDCTFCHMQWPILQSISKKYGIPIRLVSIDGGNMPGVDAPVLKNRGQAQRMEIKVVPALVLAAPPDDFVIMTQGFLARPTLERRILLAAESAGILTDEMKRLADPSLRGVLTADSMNADMKEIGDDPDKMVEYLREQMGAEYNYSAPEMSILPVQEKIVEPTRFNFKQRPVPIKKAKPPTRSPAPIPVTFPPDTTDLSVAEALSNLAN